MSYSTQTVPCVHISTHFTALFLIISWKERLHSGKTSKCLALHVHVKRDFEKQGGEHRERASRTENYDPEKSHRHPCWRVRKKWVQETGIVLEHDSVNLQRVDNEILGHTGRRDDDSSLCKKQTHGPYTHYREQRTAWLLSARSQVVLGVCISSVS